MNYYYIKSDELYHHGVKGMKWGVRKQQRIESRFNKRVSKEGNNKYGVEYNRWGNSSIRNQSGKKMSYRTQRATEKMMKSRDRKTYNEYKHYKNRANSGMAYVGNSADMAMTVAAINMAGQSGRDSAQYKAQKMLSDYYNIQSKKKKG